MSKRYGITSKSCRVEAAAEDMERKPEDILLWKSRIVLRV